MKNILIVEDEEDLCKVFTLRAQKSGFGVITAGDGLQALAKVQTENIDLIVLDLMMPHMNGFEFCARMKADEKTKGLPIIVLSALSAEEDRIRVMESGADAYFVKPFDLDILIAEVNKCLNQ